MVIILILVFMLTSMQANVIGEAKGEERSFLYSCVTSDGVMHVFWSAYKNEKETTIHTIYDGMSFREKRLNITPTAVKEGRNYIHLIGSNEDRNGSRGILYVCLNYEGDWVSFLNLTFLEKSVGKVTIETDDKDNVYLVWAEKNEEMGTTEIMCGRIYDIDLGEPKFSGKIRVTHDSANSLSPSLAVNDSRGYLAWVDETSGRFQVWYRTVDFDTKSMSDWKALTYITTTRYPEYSKSSYLAQKPKIFDNADGLDVFWLDYRNNNLPPDKWGFDIYHRKFDYNGNPLSEEHRLTTHIRIISDFTVENAHFFDSSLYSILWKEKNRLYQLHLCTKDNSLMIMAENGSWYPWNANMNIKPTEIYRFNSQLGRFSIWIDRTNSTLGIFYTDMRDVNPWDYFPEEFCLFSKPVIAIITDITNTSTNDTSANSTNMTTECTLLKKGEKLLSKAGGLEFFKWTLIIAAISFSSGVICALIAKWKENNILKVCSGLITSLPIFSLGTIVLYYGYIDVQILELIAGSILSPTGFIISGLVVPSYFRKTALAAASIALLNFLLDLLFWYSIHPISIFS